LSIELEDVPGTEDFHKHIVPSEESLKKLEDQYALAKDYITMLCERENVKLEK
jgi:hypothetical protein